MNTTPPLEPAACPAVAVAQRRIPAGTADRNLGPQPIAQLLAAHNLKPHDLVAASPVPMTHKMVARACKGRRLTPNTQSIVLNALNKATGKSYTLPDLFAY